jgi:glycosyltransferase involved in cell wall biosynthesis
MFPCKQAREPYEKVPVLRKSFRRNDSKFFYVPSAILDLNIDDKKMQRFSDFGIPQDAFVVTYFGRHNLIKGYDILKIVGTALLDKYPKLYFLCAGIGDLQPVNHPGWIELGFINNAHELLYQSNLYILPNRETFFDLITLEILRSSTPIILSETGGNRYFKEELPKEEIEGFDFFNVNNIDDLISKVEAHINEYYNNRDKYEQKAIANRSLYLKRFTVESFVKSYLSKINSLR